MPADAAAAVTGTLVTIETPDDARSAEESEYPFPDDRNRRVFDAYARMAADHPALRLCGRLGEYRYLDMDQAIARELVHADRILAEHA